MAYEVTFIPGDGTGPELAEATRRVLEGTGVEFDWDVPQAGIDEDERSGNPFPPETPDSLKGTAVGIKAPTTTPVGSGFRSVDVVLRKELDLYACVRPRKAYEGVRTRFPEADIQYKGLNTVNPTALMLSGAHMLDHLGKRDAAMRTERAIAEVIRVGEKVTYDLKPHRDEPTGVATCEFADAVLEEMNA